MRRLLVGSVALLVVVAVGSGAAARSVFGSGEVTRVTDRTTAACMPTWRIVASGRRAPNLKAVAVLSPRDVWAVGERADEQSVLVHWDGRRLRSYPSNGELWAVAAASSDDVWAVGSGPVAVHWNGQHWRRVALPRVRGGEGNLYGVAAISARDVWAVGDQGDSRRVLVMHWDGTRWRLVEAPTLPLGPFGSLYDVDAASSGDVWAVGVQTENPYALMLADLRPLLLRWSANAWRTGAPFANGTLDAVDVPSAGEAWAVGTDYAGDSDPVLRWPDTPTIAFRYSGRGGLVDLAVTPNTVWLVGYRSTSPDRPLVVKWEGRAWHAQTTPMDRLNEATLRSIAALSAKEIWAVGNHLVARYSC